MLLVIPFLGIVHPGWIITNYFFTATTVLCLGAMGIAVSVGARTSLQGALTGLCLAFVMLPIFLIFIFLDPMLIGVRAYQFLLFGSGLEGVIALLCLRMAVNSLRACSETGVELERLSGLARLSIRPSYGESFTSVHLSAFRDRFCPPVGDAPLLWKDLYRKNLTGTLTGFYLLSSILIGLLALIVTHHISQNVDAQARWNLNDVARYFGVGAIVLGMIPIPIIAAQMVSREHENGTLDPLLTTLLERKEILLSKFKVSVLPTRWVAVLIAGLLFLGMLVGTIHPVAFAALIASLVVYGVLLSCLGLFFSTFFLSTRVATSITLLILLALGCSSFGTFPVSGDNHDGLNWALCIMRDAVSPLATMNMLAFDSNDLQIKRNEIQAAMGALLVVGLAALLLWKLTVIQFGSVGSPSHRLARPQQ